MLKDKLRSLREKKGLNQKEFAKKFNMSDSRYNQYETGKRLPDYDTLKNFADFYDVSVDFLLDRNIKNNNISEVDEGFSVILNDEELRVAIKELMNLSDADKNEIINYIKFKKNNNN